MIKILSVILLIACTNAQANQLRFIHGWSVGGATDFLARTLADQLEKKSGISVIVENRIGANGTIAAEYVARSTPDRNFILIGESNFILNHHLVTGGLTFNPYKDLVPVSHVAQEYLVLAVHKSVPVRDFRSLIKLAKQQPQKIAIGYGSIGHPNYIAMKLLQQHSGILFNEIGYKSTVLAVTDLAGGHIDVLASSVKAITPHLGKVQILAKFNTRAKPPGANDVPSMISLGLPIELSSDQIIFAPATIDKERLAWLRRELNAIIASDEFAQRIALSGMIAIAMTPEQLREHLDRTIKTSLSALVKEVKN